MVAWRVNARGFHIKQTTKPPHLHVSPGSRERGSGVTFREFCVHVGCFAHRLARLATAHVLRSVSSVDFVTLTSQGARTET